MFFTLFFTVIDRLGCTVDACDRLFYFFLALFSALFFFSFFFMMRRPPRSTPLYSSAASDVYNRHVLRLALRHVLRQRRKRRSPDARLRAGHRAADAAFCLAGRAAAARLDKIPAQARRGFGHLDGAENADRRSLAFARIIRYTSYESEGFLCL